MGVLPITTAVSICIFIDRFCTNYNTITITINIVTRVRKGSTVREELSPGFDGPLLLFCLSRARWCVSNTGKMHTGNLGTGMYESGTKRSIHI